VLTRSGWVVVVAAVAAVVAGRTLGMVGFYVLGAGLAALAVASVVWVLAVRTRVTAWRTVHPNPVHAGSVATVELGVANTGARRSPTVEVVDTVGARRRAEASVAPLPAGGRDHATYRLACPRRGVLRLGPLQVNLLDPLGLASLPVGTGPHTTEATELVVYPTVVDIPAVPLGGGADADVASHQPQRFAGGGDFHALRPWVEGDDLRRVHWPASARIDDLVVRTEEQHWRGHTTVVVDDRATSHTTTSFDEVVSVAASVLAASARRGDTTVLATASGQVVDAHPNARTPSPSTRPGPTRPDPALEHLAVLAPVAGTPHPPAGEVPGAPDLRPADPAVGATVVVTTPAGLDGLADQWPAATRGPGGHRGTRVVIVVGPGERPAPSTGVDDVVAVADASSLPAAWGAWVAGDRRQVVAR
jgi:hypothetical protein